MHWVNSVYYVCSLQLLLPGLIEHMQQEGSRTLREQLQGLSVKGRINRSGQMGVNWRYAYQFPKSG